MELTLIIIACTLFFLAAFPLKNYLEIKAYEKKEKYWINWLHEKPGKQEYCDKYSQSEEGLSCDYCGSQRQLPRLEAALVHKPNFGIITNTYKHNYYFRSYLCCGCGTELFRERSEG